MSKVITICPTFPSQLITLLVEDLRRSVEQKSHSFTHPHLQQVSGMDCRSGVINQQEVVEAAGPRKGAS